MLNIIKFIFTVILFFVSVTILAAVWIDSGLTPATRIIATFFLGTIILSIFYLYYRILKNKRGDDK